MTRKASNWVDRGDDVELTLRRVLGYPLALDADDPQLVEHVAAVRGLAEADATELHVARYVRPLFERFGQPEPDPIVSRTLGIALWD